MPRTSFVPLRLLLAFLGIPAALPLAAAPVAERLFEPAPGSPIALPSAPGTLAAADVDGDGDSDLVVAGGQPAALYVLRAADGRYAGPGTPLSLAESPGEVAAGDADGDGRADVFLASHDSYEVVLLLGQPDGGLRAAPVSPIRLRAGDRPHTHGLAVEDLDGDGDLDVLTVNHDDGEISVALGDGRGNYRAAGSFPAGQTPYPVAIADLDGDGVRDVAAPNVTAGTVTVVLRDGDGGFTPAPYPSIRVTPRPYFAAAGDLDGDGRVDLVVTHDDTSVMTVLRNTGSGFRAAPGSPVSLGSRAFAAVVRDLDGDGRPEVVVATGTGVTVLRSGADGRLAPAESLPTGGGTWRLVVNDLNGDGRPDLAATALEERLVSILRGRAGR